MGNGMLLPVILAIVGLVVTVVALVLLVIVWRRRKR
jgi:LPXTG-motif cell wall-anchored protein